MQSFAFCRVTFGLTEFTLDRIAESGILEFFSLEIYFYYKTVKAWFSKVLSYTLNTYFIMYVPAPSNNCYYQGDLNNLQGDYIHKSLTEPFLVSLMIWHPNEVVWRLSFGERCMCAVDIFEFESILYHWLFVWC